MFEAKYSRLTFWIWSVVLWIPLSLFATLGRVTEMDPELTKLNLFSSVLLLIVLTMWMNALANRIRDYGSNPWIAVFSLIPLVNVGLALYYGIVKYKKKPIENSTNINNSPSLSKAVYNHSKDIASDIKPTINEYKEKHQTTKTNTSNISSIDEDEIYEKVMIEIEEDNKVKSTWAKALAHSDGDKEKAEALYIKERVANINKEQLEHLKNVANKIINEEYEKSSTFINSMNKSNKKNINPEKKINIKKVSILNIDGDEKQKKYLEKDILDFKIISTEKVNSSEVISNEHIISLDIDEIKLEKIENKIKDILYVSDLLIIQSDIIKPVYKNDIVIIINLLSIKYDVTIINILNIPFSIETKNLSVDYKTYFFQFIDSIEKAENILILIENDDLLYYESLNLAFNEMERTITSFIKSLIFNKNNLKVITKKKIEELITVFTSDNSLLRKVPITKEVVDTLDKDIIDSISKGYDFTKYLNDEIYQKLGFRYKYLRNKSQKNFWNKKYNGIYIFFEDIYTNKKCVLKHNSEQFILVSNNGIEKEISIKSFGYNLNGLDELYEEAKDFILTSNKTSISSIQRKLLIGCNRATTIVEQLEINGVLSTPDASGDRKILI